MRQALAQNHYAIFFSLRIKQKKNVAFIIFPRISFVCFFFVPPLENKFSFTTDFYMSSWFVVCLLFLISPSIRIHMAKHCIIIMCFSFSPKEKFLVHSHRPFAFNCYSDIILRLQSILRNERMNSNEWTFQAKICENIALRIVDLFIRATTKTE